MATWKKVLLEGLDLTGSDVINNQKDLVIGAGLSLDGTAGTSATTQAANNVLLGIDSDLAIAINIDGQTDLGNGVAGGDLLLVADISDSNKIKRTTVADIIGAVDTGVTSITGSNGVAVNTSTGAVTVSFDTSTLNDGTVTGTTEFVISNNDVEAVEAASDISLGVFDNSTTAFINLTALSVIVETAGTANLAYNNTNGVFTYTPPDLSGYQLAASDKYAKSWAWTNGTTAGPTAVIEIENGTDVTVAAVPAATDSVSGIVTTTTQSFAGNKTFTNNVVVTGDLTVNGTTTTLQTATLTVEDINVILANPDSAYATDDSGALAANTAAAGGGITLTTHHGSNEAMFAGIRWKNASAELTGWEARDTADYSGASDAAQEGFPISIMEFSNDGIAPGGDAAGVGSYHFDKNSKNLYIRVD